MKKRIAILGGGESGVGAALLAMAKGMDVFVSDKGKIEQKYKYELEENSISYEEGVHTEALILNADVIVKSPGIPDKAELIQTLIKNNKQIISEIEFASEFTKAKFIGITGSNGKTTTTLLTYHLLKKSGLNVGLAGNIGYSLARQVIEDKFEYYVLELSSFQLDGVYKFKAHLAVLLNITPDHLDRYEYKFENYVESKFRITKNQSPEEYFIYNADDPVIVERLANIKTSPQLLGISLNKEIENGAYKADQTLLFNISGNLKASFKIDIDQIPLKGRHNMINTMAALLAGAALGIDPSGFLNAIKDFKNVSHRLEDAGGIGE
ncbi:MAG TPA: UDP-N-acetylmuramoyl-L-alanine--D-glutamate ligase, partial [Cytophagaceae bacterium]